MKKILLILTTFLLFSCVKEDDMFIEPIESTELLFVANEGNFGSSNGSISIINQKGNVNTIENIGDVVQSILVHNNKLFVIVNNSHKIKIFDIYEEGIRLPGIEISTNGSSPREMVVFDNKLYFTNWNTQDVKILNLFTYGFETSIKVDGLPESITTDGESIFVGIMMNSDYSDASDVIKINPKTNQITKTYNVGKGPTSLLIKDKQVYVARTYYDSNWNAFYGTSKIDLINGESIMIMNYGTGVVCGGSMNSFKGNPYRSYKGGVAMLEKSLKINESSFIGDFDESNIYSIKTINDKVYLGTNDGYVKIIDENNIEISKYKVGNFPGDFEIWTNNLK